MDYANMHLYWSDMELNVIERINCDGDPTSRRIIAIGSKVGVWIKVWKVFALTFLHIITYWIFRIMKLHCNLWLDCKYWLLKKLSSTALYVLISKDWHASVCINVIMIAIVNYRHTLASYRGGNEPTKPVFTLNLPCLRRQWTNKTCIYPKSSLSEEAMNQQNLYLP